MKEQKQPFKKVLCKNAGADVWKCSVEKMFLKILQNSQEDTCARVAFLKMKAESCSFI